MTASRRRFLKLASFALAASAVSRSAFAAEWPKEEIIRAVIAFNPGANIDITGRIVADALSQRIGQSIVIENRGGAGSTLGTHQVARAEPDGYTLLIQGSSHTVTPALYKTLPYDPVNDFAGIGIFGEAPMVLMAAPNKGYDTLQDLVARAKTGHLTFGSSGVGSGSHWAIERLRYAAKFKATHVPFRGPVQSVTEVMTGRIDFCCVGIAGALGFIRSGKVKPLCIVARTRFPQLPDVISVVEAGYKDATYYVWMGMLAPAKTPRSIIDRLNAELAAVVAKPEVRKKLEVLGMECQTTTPAAFDALIRKEIEENRLIARAAGLEPI